MIWERPATPEFLYCLLVSSFYPDIVFSGFFEVFVSLLCGFDIQKVSGRWMMGNKEREQDMGKEMWEKEGRELCCLAVVQKACFDFFCALLFHFFPTSSRINLPKTEQRKTQKDQKNTSYSPLPLSPQTHFCDRRIHDTLQRITLHTSLAKENRETSRGGRKEDRENREKLALHDLTFE